MFRIPSRTSSTVRRTAWASAMGLLVILAIGWAFRQGEGPRFERPLHAATTQAGDNFVMATGQIDEAVEGVFFLDRVTGTLQCWVTSKNTMAFNGKFIYVNVLEDVGEKEEKNPQLLMMVGNYQPIGANGKIASCLVYVLNETTGKFAVYTVPWNAVLHGKRIEPYVSSMTLLNIGMTREPIRQ